jgi:pimeloyl-ACP methyl ester carboxylesterase
MPWRESEAELARARAEQPALVDSPLGRLFGIFTPPAPDAPEAGLCVVFLTRPRSHRNRMWVEGARRLSARGFACFRFDYHGTGDSEGDAAKLDPNQPYRADILAVLRHLRDRLGQRSFVLCGACFDARTALAAFPEEGGAIAGLVFMVAPAMELDVMDQANADHKDWRHLMKALGKADNWRALGRAERWRYMAAVAGRVARRGVPGMKAGGLPLSAGFLEDFTALVRSHARALFLYGEEDDVYRSFAPIKDRLLQSLDSATRSRIEVEVWPGPMHGFIEIRRQREAFERVVGWIEALRPRAATAKPLPKGDKAWISS